VYIPTGTYLTDYISMAAVTVQGAGMWYTKMVGLNSRFNGNGDSIHVQDVAFWGESTVRFDTNSTQTALVGSWGQNSTLKNIWVEHKKDYLWTDTSPVDNNLQISNSRIRDTFADGINFNSQTTNSTVNNCNFRNTQDDSLATWTNAGVNTSVTFSNNLIQNTLLANGIGVYGGNTINITGNIIADTANNGNGILLSTDFSNTTLNGTETVSNNTMYRCGTATQYDTGFTSGAFRIYAKNTSINTTMNMDGNQMLSCPYAGIQFQGWGSPSITGDSFTNTTVNGYGTYGIWVTNNAFGSASFATTTVSGGTTGLQNDAPSNFTITKGSGNSGF